MLFKVMCKKWNIDVECHCIDIVYESDKLERIFRKNKIDYVIHCAALKYMDIAEEEPSSCININIIGTENIINIANKYVIKNMIALSTDKAINPINTYGMSKYFMEKIIIKNDYSVYQCVNFFWSDGSVLDIWHHQIRQGSNLCVTNYNQERYFIDIEIVCDDIINNIHIKQKILLPSTIFKLKVLDLFTSMIDYFNYDKDKYCIIGDRCNEKNVELINENQSGIISYTKEQLKDLISKTLRTTEINT